MSIDQSKEQIPDFARDVRLNLTSMMGDETLSPQSKYGLLLASAVATRNPNVTAAMETAAAVVMTSAAAEAGKSAASVMAMNNVYYRFVHLASNPEYKTMPARLRMNWLGNPRVDRANFELWALAVSAINGCGACRVGKRPNRQMVQVLVLAPPQERNQPVRYSPVFRA